MQRVLFAAVALFALPSCAQWPQIVGEYSHRVKYADVRELRAIVRQRPDIEKPIYRISMFYDADRAYVECGDPTPDRPTATAFTAYKKQGQWIIDEKSIHKIELIITSDISDFESLQGLTNRFSQPLFGVARRCRS